MYRQRAAPRCQRRQPALAENQQGLGIGDFFRVAKKIAKGKIARNIGKKALQYLPDVYENLSGKIKNKELKKIFDSVVQKNWWDTDRVIDKIIFTRVKILTTFGLLK